MNGFQANGLFNLLRNPAFKGEIQKRFDELVWERADELTGADYWAREEILAAIQRQLKQEFAKDYSLF